MHKPRQLSPEERQLLSKFLRLEITLAELLRRMQGVFEFNFTPGIRTFAAHFCTPEPGVPVTRSDIDYAVAKNERGEISKEHLTEWATMILLNDAYGWQGPDEEEIANRLNDLSMPQLFSKHPPKSSDSEV